MGVITKGDSFELQRPTQVVFTVRGTCTQATDSYLETELSYLSGDPHKILVSRTDLASRVVTTFTNGACLRLPAGKYSFEGRIRSNPGGVIGKPNIELATATLYDDANYPDFVGQALAFGSNNGFVLVSTSKELPVMAAARISATLPAGERLMSTIRITDTVSGASISAPRSQLAGTNLGPLETTATPIYLQPGRIYKFHFDLIYGGAVDIAASISVSG
jgi:hypothetical protein